MSNSTRKPYRPMARGIRRALLSPFNLAVAGAGTACAAVMSSLPLLALGGAAYAAMVAWDLSSPGFWRKVVGGDQDADAALPRPREVFDADTRAALERVHAARKAIGDVVAETPASTATSLQSVLATLEELDGGVGRLVARSDDLSRYLAGNDEDAVRAESAALAARAQRAPDAETRKHYAEAHAALDDKLRTLGEIAAARERLLANLAQIVATLEGIPAKVVRVRALDAQAADDLSGTLGRELEGMNVEMRALEETLESLAEPAR